MRAISLIAGLVFFSCAILFGTLLYTDHIARRDCFNDQGRCFDATSGTVILAQSGLVWLGLTVLSLAAAVLCIWWFKKIR
ncbi:MAG: hypothetical protein AAF231_07875 [Pseudomonadota bacterium]